MTPLTEREMAVLRLTADGMTSGQAARSMCISPSLAQNVAHSMRMKLGAVSMANAVHLAHLAGLLSDQAGRDYIAEHRVQLAEDLAQLAATQ